MPAGFSTFVKLPEKLTFLLFWDVSYHGVRNVSFSEKFARKLDEWSLILTEWNRAIHFHWKADCELKHHTHVKKVGHTAEFVFGIYELEKQLLIQKTVKVDQKKVRILIFTILYLNKIKKNTLRYYFTPVYQKSWWYDLQFLRYRFWQTENGNYGSFFAPTNYLKINFRVNSSHNVIKIILLVKIKWFYIIFFSRSTIYVP